MALAAIGSGATVEEARTAALTAVRTMLNHGLVPGQPSAIDLDEVAALAIHAAELEHLLAAERATHAAELRDRDRCYAVAVQAARDETRAAVREERATLARRGGEARAERLDDGRKTEIAKTAASARWARWRERKGLASP